MKFMKLGSKPDAFQAEGKSVRYVSSELATDVTINVGEVKFYLHKFPLLSKSNRLQKLVLKATEENSNEINMPDFPGGPKAFEICAKFCYGMTVTLNAYSVVAARCAAEYLEMTEDIDRGNLIFKIEVFLNSSIFRSWKDSIIVLQTTKSLLPWSEDLKIVGRCVDSIASKTSVDPTNITWSYTYNRKLSAPDSITEDGLKYREKCESVPKDWWVEDICELDIDLYKRVMIAIKSKGRMDGAVVAEALKTYAVRWLPDRLDELAADGRSWRYKYLVETLVGLLPSGKSSGCPCSFLLKLLKVAIFVGVDGPPKEDLMERVGSKLYEASVKDLLVPGQAPQETVYDVELVRCLVDRYMASEMYGGDLSVEKIDETDDFVLRNGSAQMVSVGKLIDGYLLEIADDPNLELSGFVELARAVPDSARPVHDGIYKAIDIYLKEHPDLTKAERKKLCGLMDVKKLSPEASMHAAQNEHLPLRVVVQVLFFEQVRASIAAQSATNTHDTSNSVTNTDEEESEKTTAIDGEKLVKNQMSKLRIKEEETRKNGQLVKKNSKNSKSGIQLLPSRSRRIFDKIWVMGKGHNGENKSSGTSVSSQSPTSVAPGDTKSSGSSSRQRRHSIS